MKAILVIDVDDRFVEDEDDRFSFAIDVYLMQESDCAGCFEAVGYITNAVLKPMPQKKETRSAIQYSGLAEEYRKEGWNECLDEILGETE